MESAYFRFLGIICFVISIFLLHPALLIVFVISAIITREFLRLLFRQKMHMYSLPELMLGVIGSFYALIILFSSLFFILVVVIFYFIKTPFFDAIETFIISHWILTDALKPLSYIVNLLLLLGIETVGVTAFLYILFARPFQSIIFHQFWGIGIKAFSWKFYLFPAIILPSISVLFFFPWYQIFYIGTSLRLMFSSLIVGWKEFRAALDKFIQQLQVLISELKILLAPYSKRSIFVIFGIGVFMIGLSIIVGLSLKSFIGNSQILYIIRGRMYISIVEHMKILLTSGLLLFVSVLIIAKHHIFQATRTIFKMIVRAGTSEYHNMLKKFRLLTRTPVSPIIHREEISKNFMLFNTSYWRFVYIQSLNRYRIVAKGEWPDGKLPNAEGDEASTLLAKLEEKWLGFDR